MSRIHSYLQLGGRKWTGWWCGVLSPSTAEWVESGWSPPNTCKFWFMSLSNTWRGLLFAHNFSPHPICCKNILGKMSTARGHFCLPPPKVIVEMNKVAPCPLAPHPQAPALSGGNGDSSLALTFHSSCFASMNEIKHDMGTEAEHMLMTPRMLHTLAWFASPVKHTHIHAHTYAHTHTHRVLNI